MSDDSRRGLFAAAQAVARELAAARRWAKAIAVLTPYLDARHPGGPVQGGPDIGRPLKRWLVWRR